jgi:hypothetical protein
MGSPSPIFGTMAYIKVVKLARGKSSLRLLKACPLQVLPSSLNPFTSLISHYYYKVQYEIS